MASVAEQDALKRQLAVAQAVSEKDKQIAVLDERVRQLQSACK